jgi:single stranded DNA-binding protein
MSRGFARVTLVGNLTRDPELRQTPNGNSVCQLGVAVGRRFKDASGQWVDKASFFDIVVWGAQGENCAQYLSKGRQVAIDGGPGRQQAQQGRDRRRERGVRRRPRRPRRPRRRNTRTRVPRRRSTRGSGRGSAGRFS